MIDEHFESIEKVIRNDSLAILINLSRTYTSQETGYIKGNITFIDRSSLAIFQHVRVDRDTIAIRTPHYLTVKAIAEPPALRYQCYAVKGRFDLQLGAISLNVPWK